MSKCENNPIETDNGKQFVQFKFVGTSTAVKLAVEDIIYIETDRHRNLFVTKNKTYSIYKRLDEIEKELAGMGFVRVHMSFLVNMRYIEKISSYRLKLTTGAELSVPKARYKNVKKEYAMFMEKG